MARSWLRVSDNLFQLQGFTQAVFISNRFLEVSHLPSGLVLFGDMTNFIGDPEEQGLQMPVHQ